MKHLCTIAIFLTALFCFFGCSSNNTKAVKMVKYGTLDMCPDVTVEEMVNGFMGNPSWEEIKGTDRNTYVNISGDITYFNKPVKALLQFKVGTNTFEFNALEFNGVGQNPILANALLVKMCGADNLDYEDEE